MCLAWHPFWDPTLWVSGLTLAVMKGLPFSRPPAALWCPEEVIPGLKPDS